MAITLRTDPASSQFRGAVLSDGTRLEGVHLTRASGYDTSVWVTDGVIFAPIHSVVLLEGPK